VAHGPRKKPLLVLVVICTTLREGWNRVMDMVRRSPHDTTHVRYSATLSSRWAPSHTPHTWYASPGISLTVTISRNHRPYGGGMRSTERHSSFVSFVVPARVYVRFHFTATAACRWVTFTNEQVIRYCRVNSARWRHTGGSWGWRCWWSCQSSSVQRLARRRSSSKMLMSRWQVSVTTSGCGVSSRRPPIATAAQEQM